MLHASPSSFHICKPKCIFFFLIIHPYLFSISLFLHCLCWHMVVGVLPPPTVSNKNSQKPLQDVHVSLRVCARYKQNEDPHIAL